MRRQPPRRPAAGAAGVRRPLGPGAIGTAEWTGVALADVLRAAGAQADAALHVAFSACDEVAMPEEGRFRFGVSIPMAKAMSPEVLLAFAMNGEALAPEHGFPLRVVVPGFAGVRSPKWLETIIVQDAPSDNHMQQRDYRLVPPDVTAETVDWARGVTINELPLNSAICDPAPHAALKPGRTTTPCLSARAAAPARSRARGAGWHRHGLDAASERRARLQAGRRPGRWRARRSRRHARRTDARGSQAAAPAAA